MQREPPRGQWRPGDSDARTKVIRVQALDYALSHPGYAGQAVLGRRIAGFHNAGSWRPHRKSTAVHFHIRTVQRRIEPADASFGFISRRIQLVPQSEVQSKF